MMALLVNLPKPHEVTVTVSPVNDNDPVFRDSDDNPVTSLTWTVPENAASRRHWHSADGYGC